MNSRKIQRIAALQDVPNLADFSQAFGGLLALLEIAIATTIVVGIFDAVSQPVSALSGSQFLLCACLAVLLWLADGRRKAEDSCAGNAPVASACRETTTYEPARQES
jgi:hypothetical protein